MLLEVSRAPVERALALPSVEWHRPAIGTARTPRSEPEGLTACLDDWNRGAYHSTRSASARAILTELKPHLLAAARQSDHAQEIIGGFDRLVRQLLVGTHLFASLAADPSALQTLLQLVTRAPRLAPIIAERPDVFDALISREPSADVMSLADMARALTHLKASCATDAELLRRVQHFTRKHQFLISARAMLGLMPLRKAGDAFSKLAFAVVQALAALAERRFQKRHGRATGSDWALVALGKFGGFELTATSDLDLMLVYEISDDDGDSGASSPLPRTQYFNKLAQEIIAVLGAPAGDGPLFEVDFRLRPWGNKGPIATRLSTLRQYLQQDAWNYERMAMTRARIITGSPHFSAAIETVTRRALHRSPAAGALRADVLEMHQLIHTVAEADNAGTNNPWDIKHVRGGLIDIEFIAQYLMLRHAQTCASEHPGFIHAATAEALAHLRSIGGLGVHDFKILSQAQSSFTDVMQAVRLACLPGPLPGTMSNAFASCLPSFVGESSLGAVEAELRQLQASVRAAFDRLTAA
jgi:glutamate-ammonia-ligase adenylyltransferase